VGLNGYLELKIHHNVQNVKGMIGIKRKREKMTQSNLIMIILSAIGIVSLIIERLLNKKEKEK